MDPGSESRRNFLGVAAAGFGAAAVLGALYPALQFLWPRQKAEAGGGKRSLQVPLAETPVGEAKFVRFLNKPTVVLRPNEQEVFALSAICTHLGCVVKWNERSGELDCPCHGGRFDTKGNVLGGPPPAPLPGYAARLDGDYIVIEEA
ncbi:MAG: Rieske 2Fe-2S domain-containing protein [Nitrospinae bacterium]|nr:Rieske 2Fe-2S domain-containing protein [Nitrospinota bacterium]